MIVRLATTASEEQEHRHIILQPIMKKLAKQFVPLYQTVLEALGLRANPPFLRVVNKLC